MKLLFGGCSLKFVTLHDGVYAGWVPQQVTPTVSPHITSFLPSSSKFSQFFLNPTMIIYRRFPRVFTACLRVPLSVFHGSLHRVSRSPWNVSYEPSQSVPTRSSNEFSEKVIKRRKSNKSNKKVINK